MTINAAALRLMREKGMTLDDVCEIAAAMEVRRDPSAAERQQRYRHRAKADAVTRNVTCDENVTAAPSLDKSPQTPKINPNPAHTHETPARAASAWPCPEGVEPSHWRDFLGNRKRKRLASTETAHAAVLRDLQNFSDDDWSPGRLVELAASKSWGSIVDPHEISGPKNGTQRNGFAPTQQPSGHGRTVDAARDWIAGH